jgi:hypothetical protein
VDFKDSEEPNFSMPTKRPGAKEADRLPKAFMPCFHYRPITSDCIDFPAVLTPVESLAHVPVRPHSDPDPHQGAVSNLCWISPTFKQNK